MRSYGAAARRARFCADCERARPRSTTAKNVIAEIGSLLEPLWKLEARISPWIRRICAAQAPIRNAASNSTAEAAVFDPNDPSLTVTIRPMELKTFLAKFE